MSKKPRDTRPYLRPVTRVELDQTNVKLRWILVVAFLVIAITAFGIGMNEVLKTEPGWQSVRATSDQPNSSAEFVLMYDFSQSGAAASQVNKELENYYSQLCEEAFGIFSPDIAKAGLQNVNYVNASPNQEISVDPALYAAFELLQQYSNRSIFLAPVYVEYDRIFRSESDPEAMDNDPARNTEVHAYLQELIRYTSDENMVSLDLLGNNHVRLNVADAYLEYARENDIVEFIDFAWLRNAFVADYMAECLVEQGYTDGYVASYDGFTRNLMQTETTFQMNLFNLEGRDIKLPAVMEYTSPASLVFLRSYPIEEMDEWNSYVYDDGTIVTGFIDPCDGVSKSSLTNMVSYSKNYGCAEILMQMIPIYVADEFRAEAVNDLTDNEIYSVWFENGVLNYNEQSLKLKMLTDEQGNYCQSIYAK